MPALKTYDLFISHAWNHNHHYYSIEKLLYNASLFKWRNYSVPIHDPLIDSKTIIGKKKLESLLEKQVKPVNCVIIIGGMFAAHSDWILKEIKLAQYYNKPIIGIYPRGQLNMPKAVQNSSHELVGWNTKSIIDAIRRNSI